MPDGASLHLREPLDPAVEARMLVAQAGGTRVSRGWTITATANVCGLDQDTSEAWIDHACTTGLLERIGDTLRLAGAVNHRYPPIHPTDLATAQAAVTAHDLERRHTWKEPTP